MSPDLLPVISYVLITTFTPGPSNLTSASLGVLYGFRRSLAFQVGLAAGFIVVMALSGWISATLLAGVPVLEPILRYLGAAYILYLAYTILRESYAFQENHPQPLGFGRGLLLQILNPKMIVYAFTLFTAVLTPFIKTAPRLISAVALLALTSFCATAVWALFGAAIKTYLHHPRVRSALNIILALLLVLTAIQLTGLL